MDKKIRICLAGNPNSGKTSIFNAMTGARQHVANYPGVTVERKVGTCNHGGHEIEVTDLPGTYSLTTHSIEELVARDILIGHAPNVVVDVIDATNLERNLYLAVQLLELGVPLVLAFNMSDVARARGVQFSPRKFSKLLGVPVIPTVGHKGAGVRDLLNAVVRVAAGRNGYRAVTVRYGPRVEKEIRNLEHLLAGHNGDFSRRQRRWLAVKMLENDSDVRTKIGSPDILAQADEGIKRIEELGGDDPGVLIADERYRFISSVCERSVRFAGEGEKTVSDRVDAVVTNRFLALPIFLGFMFLVFHVTFTLGNPVTGLIESFFTWLASVITASWPSGLDSPLKSLLVDGIIGGVGGVIVFLPNILFLFLAISVLEDSGYMARAAFIMDRLMHHVGLHGKSFIPMLIGFGCNVPAIMATRTLESRRDRLVTMLVVPLMSCSARLTVYALIIPAFFPRAWQAPVLWIIYLIGILLAIVAANVLRKTFFKGEQTTFLMELPPYRVPTIKSAILHMWERGWLYVRKAGTIILGFSIILWFMTAYPKKSTYDVDYGALAAEAEAAYVEAIEKLGGGFGLEGSSLLAGGDVSRPDGMDDETYAGLLRSRDRLQAAQGRRIGELAQARRSEDLGYSVAGRLGRGLAPVLAPMGFDWKIGTALIGAAAAKEMFVAQMGIVYAVADPSGESEALRSQLRRSYTPLTAFCIMIFALVGFPCIATIAVTKRESNSWRWALFQLVGLTALAYVLTVTVYQLGNLFGIGV